MGTEERTAAVGSAPAAHAARRGPGLLHAVRALRSRNYRLFFAGQGISLIGTWMQSVALSWLVLRTVLDKSAAPRVLGWVGFAGQIPMLLLAPLAGVLVDRWNLRRALVGTQTAAAIQALILAALTLTSLITVWQVILLALVSGVINAVDMPARQSFVVQMVERPEDLGNAIALNSFLMNGARFVGPSLAGLLIAAIGEGPCFLVNAVSYVAVILALLAMTVSPRTPGRREHFAHGLRDGFAYAFGFPPIRAVLLLLALVSLTGMSYGVLMPVFVQDVLGGGPRTLGFLLGATGVGAVLGAFYLASRPNVAGYERIIAFGATLFGACLALVGTHPVLWLAMPVMLVAGLGMMLQIASSNTILQTIVDEDKRGRVMGLYAVAFLGVMPFGSLLAGHLAPWIGVPRTLMLGGGCCLVGALLFARQLPAFRRTVETIYARKGILAETIPTDPGAGHALDHVPEPAPPLSVADADHRRTP